jgi:hypothetical protein
MYLICPSSPGVSADGPTEKIQSGTSFSRQVRELSLRVGIGDPVGIHSGRRETLIQATSRISARSFTFQLANLSLDNGYAKGRIDEVRRAYEPNDLYERLFELHYRRGWPGEFPQTTSSERPN